ncbi:adenine-specific DNA-methyltransferase [Rhizobium sp. AN5]|uniref:SNF2-related protein n=1 Tax=Rhizobium sp. AN5 TaxID=1855304 RepID=UPI000BDD751A|nr:SNF2-related protein [Rhizobium sp. AN5]SOC92293.1 adenine-specific DNA-methyltransferase [Rhizobium sp. AN5]
MERLTEYHAKYLATDLVRRRSADSAEKLAIAVAGAQVDMNPHQVDAALFAFSSPLSRGALLADEVGLGKTIEAGLVISQRWAEGKRRILIVAPSNLRKQWHQELSEKFFLPCAIIESRSFNAAVKSGDLRPFDHSDRIMICSYQFARNKEQDVKATPWDLVVMDEAHRLRNVYKPSNIIANILKGALADRHKLLLTATPLQNSLLELYGLVSFIDEHTFGDLKSFREQFANLSQERAFEVLRERLKPICHRTLRRQVTAYVPYTKRHAILEEFDPSEAEDRLYDVVTGYLDRPNLQALPPSQRSLMTLVLRKLLASSTFAIAGALTSMSARLQKKLDHSQLTSSLVDELDEDYEALDETAEEWPDDEVEPMSEAEQSALASEINDLQRFAELATSITQNAKGLALLKALEVGFAKATELGAEQKAIIFTESRKTQSYLLRLLAESPYADGIVLFNGSNTDPRSQQIYRIWLDRHAGSDRITNSKTADMRSALVDYFREEGRIMIATEAGAEGINLQFCSMVVNYDLPWNPQRIEQRIGRCHRYGQKHDVVVVNFLNQKNEADQRVFQLLSEKFQLFEGVFGASDEVLGAIESGVDFEKRIAEIYQRCRKKSEIKVAFDSLQRELSLEINEQMTSARRKLMENFDDEVRDKLKIRDADTKVYLNQFEQNLIRLAQQELGEYARFIDGSSFRLNALPDWVNGAVIPTGLYELPRRTGEAHLFRVNHPLGEAIVSRARTRELDIAELTLDLTNHEGRVSQIEPFKGQSGWLQAKLFTVEALGQSEDYLLLAGIADNGSLLSDEATSRMMTIGGHVGAKVALPSRIAETLSQSVTDQQTRIRRTISERNARFFEEEANKLDGWADDLKVGLEREIKEIDRQIKEARRAATAALTLEEKLAGQKAVRVLETERNTKRRSLFDAQDKIDEQRSELIASIEGRLEQNILGEDLFIIRWSVV